MKDAPFSVGFLNRFRQPFTGKNAIAEAVERLQFIIETRTVAYFRVARFPSARLEKNNASRFILLSATKL